MDSDQTLLLTFFGSFGEHMHTGESYSSETAYINHYGEVNGFDELSEIGGIIENRLLASSLSESELSTYVNDELHCPFNYHLEHQSVRDWLTYIVDAIKNTRVPR